MIDSTGLTKKLFNENINNDILTGQQQSNVVIVFYK